MILSKNAENNRERFDDYRGLLRDPSEEKKTLVVDAVLSPTPRACRSCGSTVVDGNGKAIIVKNGKRKRLSVLNNTIICLWLCA